MYFYKRTIMKVIEWITSLFDAKNRYQLEVEKFIASKNPTSVVELEAWLKYYESTQLHRRWL